MELSVVIIAKNEEERIVDCLKSVVGWADEIILVDDDSTDATRSLAEKYGAKVLTRKMENEGRHRNWGYMRAKNEWVFSLDADERVTPELQEEISRTLPENPVTHAFTVPRRNFIGKYWVKNGGMYPAPQIKLFRKDKFQWAEEEVHPRPVMEGDCGHLKCDLIHYSYRNWADFMNKLNGQTTLEAKKWHKRYSSEPRVVQYKMNTFHALWRMGDRFIRTYIGRRGYRDGFIGFMVALFASLYQIVSYAKYRALMGQDK